MKKFLKGLFEATVLVLVAGMILFLSWAVSRSAKAEKAYTPTNLIRLHIIGNSDSSEDQEVKLLVRDALFKEFGKELTDAKSAREARDKLLARLSEIESIAARVVRQAGFDYGVKASVCVERFPPKYYEGPDGKGLFLPEGSYQALKISLGKAEGHNWWCVMYPPLCYLDFVMVAGTKEEQAKAMEIRDTLSRILIVDETTSQPVRVEVRSYFLDVLKQKLSEFARNSFFGRLLAEILSDRENILP